MLFHHIQHLMKRMFVLKETSQDILISDGGSQSSALLVYTENDSDRSNSISVDRSRQVNLLVENMLDILQPDVKALSAQVQETLNSMLNKITNEVDVYSIEESKSVSDVDDTEVKTVVDSLVSQTCETVNDFTGSVNSTRIDHMYAKSSSGRVAKPVKRRRSNRTPEAHLYAEKRRSARVKTTAKPKPAEKISSVSHVTKLKKFLPAHLLNEENPEHGSNRVVDTESMDCTLPPSEQRKTEGQGHNSAELLSNEQQEVQKFIDEFGSNNGIVHLMMEWILKLSAISKYKWNNDLVSLYTRVFEIHQKCFQRPNIYSNQSVERYAMAVLLWMEFSVDSMIDSPLPLDGNTSVGDTPHDKSILDQLTYWNVILASWVKLPNHCYDYTVRYFWMAAKYYMAVHKSKLALNIYTNLEHFVNQRKENELTCPDIELANITHEGSICTRAIEEQRKALDRAQSLEHLAEVYDAGNYDRVIEMLTPTFALAPKKRYTDSRHTQIHILLETGSKLSRDQASNHSTVVNLLTEALCESVSYSKTYSSEKASWEEISSVCLTRIFDLLLLYKDAVSEINLVKFVKTLCSMVEVMTNEPDQPSSAPQILTPYPWLIIHKLVEMEEAKDLEPKSLDIPYSIRYY